MSLHAKLDLIFLVSFFSNVLPRGGIIFLCRLSIYSWQRTCDKKAHISWHFKIILSFEAKFYRRRMFSCSFCFRMHFNRITRLSSTSVSFTLISKRTLSIYNIYCCFSANILFSPFYSLQILSCYFYNHSKLNPYFSLKNSPKVCAILLLPLLSFSLNPLNYILPDF